MRGRKQRKPLCWCRFYTDKKRIPEWGDGNRLLSNGIMQQWPSSHKKRIPEWGDGNFLAGYCKVIDGWKIKKESPNEGTETIWMPWLNRLWLSPIKKESPNEGTETVFLLSNSSIDFLYKKRIPEWGDGNLKYRAADAKLLITNKKRIPEWGDGNSPGLTSRRYSTIFT